MNGPAPLLRILTVATVTWILIATVLRQWWLLYTVGALFTFSIVCLYLEGRLLARDLARAEQHRADHSNEEEPADAASPRT